MGLNSTLIYTSELILCFTISSFSWLFRQYLAYSQFPQVSRELLSDKGRQKESYQ